MTIVNWQEIDTLFLDIDGTLLDRNFDNVVWEELLPTRYGAASGLEIDEARESLDSHMRDVAHTLDYYRTDYWTEYTGVDVLKLHQKVTHLLRFRPGTRGFLDWVRRSKISSMLITNADRECFSLKDTYCRLSDEVETIVSCHDYGAPKESQAFWMSLNSEHTFDSERTLFIDDDQTVLAAAERYGIRHLLTISQPDSRRPSRDGLRFQSIDNLMELVPVEVGAQKSTFHE